MLLYNLSYEMLYRREFVQYIDSFTVTTKINHGTPHNFTSPHLLGVTILVVVEARAELGRARQLYRGPTAELGLAPAQGSLRLVMRHVFAEIKITLSLCLCGNFQVIYMDATVCAHSPLIYTSKYIIYIIMNVSYILV